MIFEDGGNVVVQSMDIGGYMIVVPEQKIDAVTDALDSADIMYELQENDMNIDDMNEDMTTATVLTFGPGVDVDEIQRLLDHLD